MVCTAEALTPLARPKDWPSAPDTTLSPYLDFGHSGSVAERIHQALDEPARDFYHVGFARGQVKSRFGPELAADQGQAIREGRLRFRVPSRLPNADRRPAPVLVLLREQGHEGEEAEQRRGRAAD